MNTKIILLFLVLASPIGAIFTIGDAAAERPGNGRLCLAALPTPFEGSEYSSSPRGRNPDVDYSVRVDAGEAIELSNSRGRWVPGLCLAERHSIIILVQGEPIESFDFTFREDGPDELCLFMNKRYPTWQIRPYTRIGPWCICPLSHDDLTFKNWHTSPSSEPKTSSLYPDVAWSRIEQVHLGMCQEELEALLGVALESYHHPINAIVFSRHSTMGRVEVAFRLSDEKCVLDTSYQFE